MVVNDIIITTNLATVTTGFPWTSTQWLQCESTYFTFTTIPYTLPRF